MNSTDFPFQKGLSRFEWLLACLIGIAAFMLVFGPQILMPTNIAWLQTGDRAQHFLGWQFYRYSPWQFPIGLNPDFGLELSSAIIYSDSNPLFAIVFKALGPLLPEPFQYFGLWILVCFMLQAFFAWKIAKVLHLSFWARLCVTVLAVFAPPFLFRVLYHMSLGGHFVVLCALFLALRPEYKHKIWPWALLLSFAASLHAYLFVLTGAIWAGQLIDLVRTRQISWRKGILESLVNVGCVLATMFSVGYFSTRSVAAAGFGGFRLNLLSYFNPGTHGWEWSYLLPTLPFDWVRDGFEGFNYAGLGTLILVPFALIAIFRLQHPRLIWLKRHVALILVGLALTIFALSNEVGLGSLTFRVDLPEKLLTAANTFRASGRMFWPVFYGLLFLITVLVAKGFGRRTGCLLLTIAAVVQVSDTRMAWQYFKDERIREVSSEWETPLQASIWQAFMKRYAKIRTSSPADPAEWKHMAFLAGMHHKATDSVMLARVDESKLAESKIALRNELLSGIYAPDTLYVLDENALFIALPHINQSEDLVALIDGYFIIAPGWLSCSDCRADDVPPSGKYLRIESTTQTIKESGKRRYDFSSAASNAKYLVTGWSWSEPWGVWSSSQRARITLPASSDIHLLTLSAHPHVNKKRLKQKVYLSLNDEPAGEFDLSETLPSILRVPISAQVLSSIGKTGYLNIDFYMPDAAAPSILGTGQDDRVLGLGLHSIELYE